MGKTSSRMDESKHDRKFEKKLEFYAKVRDTMALGAQKTIKKSTKLRTRQKKLRAYNLSSLAECLPDLAPSKQPAPADFKVTSKSRQKLVEYYEKQFAALKSFEEVDSLRSTNDTDNEEQELIEQVQHERASNISNWANIFLLALKIYATVQSGSLAIAASTLDSLLDLMAGGILWFTHLSMKSINIYKYPIGKLRVQPVGIIIFAAIMATLGFQVLIQAVEHLIRNLPSDKMSEFQLI